jgi:flagellar basal-body rod modification protein FlgD
MMQAAAIQSAGAATAATSGSQLNGLSGVDFLNILIQQLQYQDPMEPMSNEEMISQMSTIRELELNTTLTDQLQSLSDQQRYAAAASMVGKYVQGSVEDGEGNAYSLEGIVTGVRFTEKGKAMLELDTGETMPMTGLELVRNADDWT